MTPCGSTCQGWFNPVDQSCQQGYWPSGGCFFAWRDRLLLTVGLVQGPCGSFLTQHLTTMLHFNSDVLHRLIRDLKLDVVGVGPKLFRQRLQVLVANGTSPTLSGTLQLNSVSRPQRPWIEPPPSLISHLPPTQQVAINRKRRHQLFFSHSLTGESVICDGGDLEGTWHWGSVSL